MKDPTHRAHKRAVAQIPRPGKPVRGSRSGAPIMALIDLLGSRWAMGILWTVCESGPLTFRELQEKCETISPTVLNKRLHELRSAKLLSTSPSGYVETAVGRRIYEQLVPLGTIAKEWAAVLEQAS